MSEYFDVLPPRELVPYLLLILVAGGGIYLFLDSIDNTQPKPAWKWGEAPRRPARGAHLPPEFVTPYGLGTFLALITVAGALGAFGG